jgi:hypothetical protein
MTGLGRRQATLSAPFVCNVVADGYFLPGFAAKVRQPCVVAGMVLIAGFLTGISGFRSRS